ncbi:helix-turn-helix domain-containing protein [Pseudomonas nitroreducens]|uniref:GlxA family transcriptional regulator n=1 Tax=Pseudomonas nitroreducens TaxID=46680 RepID=UPI0014753795|nr:helix-turn-helix domain-containing protein [Pseudomonas nitroreducens]NMZ77282.1 helix-turn-helix domain-containing protein [Pseudomonas nitroreducens]
MHRIGYLLGDGFQVMALGTQTVFEFANVSKEQVYQVTNYSVRGGPVRSSIGAVVETDIAAKAKVETWMVSGVVNPLLQNPEQAQLSFVREMPGRARRIVGLCTGSFVLAQAGLLDGRRATTHWAYADALREHHPEIRLEVDRIFIEDRGVWTSAGLTAAMDLALGIVENDLGTATANAVARVLVMYHRRSGGQSQHSQMLSLAPKSDRVQASLEFARANLAGDLTVDALSASVHLSTRQFTRVFLAETGLTPAKAIEQLRVESARSMIERGRHALEVVARENGFRDRRHLREVFVRVLGVSPLSLRRHARGEPLADDDKQPTVQSERATAVA